jgi:hypothetical protein
VVDVGNNALSFHTLKLRYPTRSLSPDLTSKPHMSE